jgi:hypothetical protein
MTRRNLNNWLGRAAMACLLLAPAMAHAASQCTSITPNFSYDPVAATGGSGAVYFTVAPAGCTWSVAHTAYLSLSAERGVGSGWLYFTIQPNNTHATRVETIHSSSVQICNANLGSRSSTCYTYAGPPLTVTFAEAGR